MLLAPCDTVNVRLATVKVPVLAEPVFAATLNVTVPLPVPLAPELIVIHDAPLVAVHGHPPAAETVMGVPAPPAAATVWLVGEMLALHAGALAAACVIEGR